MMLPRNPKSFDLLKDEEQNEPLQCGQSLIFRDFDDYKPSNPISISKNRTSTTFSTTNSITTSENLSPKSYNTPSSLSWHSKIKSLEWEKDPIDTNTKGDLKDCLDSNSHAFQAITAKLAF